MVKKNIWYNFCLNIIIKKYNNHRYNITNICSNQIFYSKDEDIFQKVLENMKNSFKSIHKDNSNFRERKMFDKNKIKIKNIKETIVGVLT